MESDRWLSYRRNPRLKRPILLMGFEGWNDAASSATMALRHLEDTWKAKLFADIDPEEFFNFAETRPILRVHDEVRSIGWPANGFYYHKRPGDERDFVILRGVEPHLKWRHFTESVLEVGAKANISMVVSLGALLAEVPHTQDIRVTGGSSDPELASLLGLGRSSYEGPTGILGVLYQSFRARGIPSVSLWANVPHYIPAFPNPRASMALLEKVSTLLDLKLDLSELKIQSQHYDEQIQEGLAQNPEVAEYVRELETRIDDDEPTAAPPAELPTGESLVADLEKFLRAQREDGGQE